MPSCAMQAAFVREKAGIAGVPTRRDSDQRARAKAHYYPKQSSGHHCTSNRSGGLCGRELDVYGRRFASRHRDRGRFLTGSLVPSDECVGAWRHVFDREVRMPWTARQKSMRRRRRHERKAKRGLRVNAARSGPARQSVILPQLAGKGSRRPFGATSNDGDQARDLSPFGKPTRCPQQPLLNSRGRVLRPCSTQGRAYVADVTEGDLWYFPVGYPHSLQGLGPDGCDFVLAFDNGKQSEFSALLVTDWVAHTPPDVLAANFGVPAET